MNNLMEYLTQCVQDFPDKCAVALRDQKYSFEQLYARARQYAYLISKTDQTNKPIGVFSHHTPETIAMFFGVLFSGNYYVPIDPEMPKKKVQMILEDANISVLIGEIVTKATVDEIGFSGHYFSPEDLTGHMCERSLQDSNAPAYMVYTSGSTGKPKGVLKSHKAVITYIESFVEVFHLSSQEVIGNQTPFFFDASAKDIYLMLKNANTLEIIPQTLFTLPPELIDYLNQKRITYICWVPTALTIVAQLNPFSLVKPTTLKKVFFVGEIMPTKYLKKWMDALPHLQYVNLYGSSEIAGICLYHRVSKADCLKRTLPMGKAMPHCRIYLLDEDGNLITNPEQTGEIHIVSDSLATQYYNDAEKTKASFFMKDFGEGPVRCFKTGDLAQYDQENNLVFTTRTDFQIKHMGRRIELGEVEAICNDIPEIARCACVYDITKRKLILVCALSQGVALKPLELKSVVKQHLTAYMVPNKIVILEQLPLNANGKIDRQLLKMQYVSE